MQLINNKKHRIFKHLGHGDYKTTENIYGNHVMRVTDEERAARRLAVKKAMKLNLFVFPKKTKIN